MKAVNISFEGAEAQKIACESGMKFVFDASVGEAEFTRDGNDLVISKGGVAIVLTSFYDVYNKDEQPSFEIDGVDIASADFFQAMNATDLQPAAGPGGQSAASAAAGGGRYSAYSDMALLDGINKLGPLDIGFNGEPPIHEYLASAGRRRGYDEERPADIADDVPLAKPDYQEMTEGKDSVVSGDVTTNDIPGADGLNDKVEWNGLADGSEYELGPDGTVTYKGETVGKLTLNEDGTYRFELDPGYDVPKGEMPHLVVDYTITDKDGDTSSSFLQIDINGIDSVTPESVYVEVYEAALPDGSAYPDMSSGKAMVAVKGDYTIVDGGEGRYGHVAYDEASGTWQYVLTKTYTDSTTVQDGSNLVHGDDVVITVQDADGNPFPVTVHVGIWDDIPSIDATAPVVTEGGTGTGTISRLYGADVPGESTVAVENGTLVKTGDHAGWYEMEYGWVKVSEDGKSYTYEAKPDTGGAKETITFIVTDADGDVAKTDVVFVLGDAPAPGTKDFLVDEADLDRTDGGNAVEFQHWSVEEMLGKGFTIVSAKLDPSGAKAGSIALDKEGTGLTYTLEHRTDGKLQKEYAERGESVRAEDTTQQETIHLIVKDAKGNNFDVDVHVNVIDDVPVLTPYSVAEGLFDNKFLTNNVDVKGMFSLEYGADGETNSGALSVTINGGKPVNLVFDNSGNAIVLTDLGKLMVTHEDKNSNVYNYEFVNDVVVVNGKEIPVAVSAGKYNVEFTAIDADGDISASNFEIEINPKPEYNLAILYDLGDNMRRVSTVKINNTEYNKIDINIQNILEQIETVLAKIGNEYDLNLSIIPFDFRAYTPETSGYFWDFGENGVYRHFTAAQLPHLKSQLEEMAVLHDIGRDNVNAWAKGRGIQIEKDVTFTGGKITETEQLIDSNHYYNSNNFQSAFDAAAHFFQEEGTSSSNNQVIITGGIWANYSNELYEYGYNNFYNFDTGKINNRNVYADYNIIKNHIVENKGVYCDSIYRYRLSENGIQYTKIEDDKFSDYFTMREGDKTIRLREMAFDIRQYNDENNTFFIGGYKYYKTPNGNSIQGAIETENHFTNGFFVQQRESSLPIDFVTLKEEILSSEDGIYSDSMFSYKMKDKDSIQYKRLTDNAFDDSRVILLNDKNININFSSLHVYDSQEFSIAGYEYKVVEHMLSTNLYYRRVGENKYIRTTENGFGDKIELLHWVGAGFFIMKDSNKSGAMQIWQKAAEAYDNLRQYSDDITFTGIYDIEEDHRNGLDNFIYYLNYHSQIDSPAIIERLIKLEAPSVVGKDANINEKLYEIDHVIKIGNKNDESFVSTVNHDEAYKHFTTTDTSQHEEQDSFIVGTVNAEILQGNTKEDFVFGGDGNDIISGDAGNDGLYGERGNDTIYGGTGDDVLSGGQGNDALYGDIGTDLLFGGNGNDYLDGGKDADYILGGNGNDIIVYDSNDIVNGGNGIDFLLVENGMVKNTDLSKLLNTINISNVEVAISGKDAMNLTDMTKMKVAGLTVREGQDGADGSDVKELVLDRNIWSQKGNVFSSQQDDLSLSMTNVEDIKNDTDSFIVSFKAEHEVG